MERVFEVKQKRKCFINYKKIIMKKYLSAIIVLILIISCKKNEEQLPLNKDLNIQKTTIKKLENAVLEEGSLYRLDSFSSKYIKPRPVDVWLPKDYSKNKKYNVLYMHDGQNLYDSTTTWNKQEWKVDEWASKLMNEGKVKDFIVVGVQSINEARWLDLFPEKAFSFMSKKVQDSILANAKKDGFDVKLNGDNYLKFIVKELKPIIDSEYSTLPGKENTFVAGSSMGGLMSMYAISEYPDIFSGAGCLSTHWIGYAPVSNNPFPEAFFKYMEANLPDSETHRLYFDYGTVTIDAYYGQYTPRIDSIFKSKGYTDSNYKNMEFKGEDHSENAWNKRLDIPLTFLLEK